MVIFLSGLRSRKIFSLSCKKFGRKKLETLRCDA